MRIALLFLALITAGPALAVEPARDWLRRDVIIPTGEVSLGATIHMPAGVAYPVPAVVLVHGSGAVDRDGMAFYLEAALELGMAVVAYDKRGTGVSTGMYQPFSVARSEADFAALARDAAMVHRWLAAQPGVDRHRVGFMGGSQAGWIMPLAAERSRAAFIIIGAGTPLTAGQEDYHSRMTGEGNRDLSRRARREANRRAARFEGPHGYDPRALLARSETPMLWVFGTDDLVIPTRLSIAEIERLRASGHLNHALHVVEDMDHNFRRPDSAAPVALAPIARPWLIEIGVLSPAD